MKMQKDLTADQAVQIAVTGFSLRAPDCSTVPEFAEALRTGRDLTTGCTRYPAGHLGLPPRQGRIKDKDIGSFDASFFSLSVKQAESMDPLIRMLLEVSYEALLDSHVDINSLRGSNTGVYVGHCFSDHSSHLTSAFKANKNGYEVVNGANSMAAHRLSFFYDFKGPSLAIDTACSSSLVALHYAFSDLMQGRCDRALVAGLSLTLNPHKNASFNAFAMLSPTGHCYAFDSRANGYCRSDGVNCIVLERTNCGVMSPMAYAIMAGTGTNSDGAKSQGITYPSAAQQACLMKSVFSACCDRVSPSQVVFHEAHGTGTIAGDKEELAGLEAVYGNKDSPLVVGSLKSNMGHAEGASGLMSVIKILLQFEEKLLYPNCDFRDSPHATIQNGTFVVLQNCKSWTPAPSSVSSFGFGGTNAFAIFLPPHPQNVQKNRLPLIPPVSTVPFSCSDKAPNPLPSKFYAVQRALGNSAPFSHVFINQHWETSSPLVFVCDGQGSHWVNMGQDLMAEAGPFRRTIEKLEREIGIPLVGLYDDGSKWMLKNFSPIGIVSFQLGLLAVLREEGIRPDYFLGHSIGELACAYLSGAATEAQVLQFALIRSKLVSLLDPEVRLDVYLTPPNSWDYEMVEGSEKKYIKRVPVDTPSDPAAFDSYSLKGKMAVVSCEANTVNAEIVALGLKETRVACFNAPKGQTVSGPTNEVDILIKKLKENNPTLFVRELDTGSIAYHSKMLKVFRSWLAEEFEALLGIRCQFPCPKSWVSTSRNSVFGVEYLVNNICGPVYFKEAIDSLPKNAVVVEIGPSSGMLAQIKRTRPDLKGIGLVDQNSKDSLRSKLVALKTVVLTPKHELLESSLDKKLPLVERYPVLWSKEASFSVPIWSDFELPQAAEHPLITFDLTTRPFSTIRGHVIKNQNLFPATGFIYAFWSAAASCRARYEILDFKIHTPLVIAGQATAALLYLHQAGSFCQLKDKDGKICYASATIQPADPNHSKVPSFRDSIDQDPADLIDGNLFYPDIRRLGYEYGPSYQMVEKVRPGYCILRHPTDWISYLDGMLHLCLLGEKSFFYPVGLDRIVFWSNTLSTAPSWAARLPHESVGNTSVCLYRIRKAFVPAVSKLPSIYRERFVEYGNCHEVEAETIAGVLARETNKFRTVSSTLSPFLQEVKNCLSTYPFMKESQSATLVFVNSWGGEDVGVAELLVTSSSSKVNGCVLVAEWGQAKIIRVATRDTSVVSDWQDAAKLDGPFIWKGKGSSGAVASLAAETMDSARSLSYEGPGDGSIAAEKGMRQNFVLEDGRHGVWVDEKLGDNSKGSLSMCRAAFLEVTNPGSLESLQWSGLDPADHPVAVSVAALNFRDIMRAMGRLKETDLSLGLEFSGVHQKTKQRIFGVALHSLASHCSPMYSYPTPPELSDEEAATIPVVYLTIYYALFHKANMKRGQTVLIHAGSGGVGIAAITVALKRGLRVFTTCSSTKREFLKQRFGLSDEQIGDSRSDSFVDLVMKGTDRQGVDVVLNQLAGPLQVASLMCVGKGGHFLEIGKYDVMENSKLSQALLTGNVSFHVIDLLPLLCDPQKKPLWDSILREGFEKREIIPLPTKAFTASEVIDAFRFMSQGKHTGKLVVTGLNDTIFQTTPVKSMANETHLITGGLGGLGLSLASKLAREGCRSLILVGRRGITNGFQKFKLQEIVATGCSVEIVTGDVQNILPNIGTEPNVIWHVATVYRDVILKDMTANDWNSVVGTKCNGYYTLRKNWPKSRIIVASSVAAYFGNALQTSYSFANSLLESEARKDPLTLAVRFGPLDNVGFITLGLNHRKLFEKLPFEVLPIDDVLCALIAISSQHKNGVFGIYDFKQGGLPTLSNKHGQKTPMKTRSSVVYSLSDAQKFIAVVLGGDPGQYGPSQSLKAAGLDSLSTMEVVHHIHSHCGNQTFKPADLTDVFTLQDMIDVIKHSKTVPATSEVGEVKEDSIVDEPVVAELAESNTSEDSSWTGSASDQSLSFGATARQTHGRRDILVQPYNFDFDAIVDVLNEADFVVLRQEDTRVFNHGAPVEDTRGGALEKFMERYVELSETLGTSRAIIVAVIEGEVRGGGMIFPAMADVCIATPSATFGLPEIHRQMVPSVVSRALVERIGQASTRRLSLTGESIDATEALRLGLVDNLIDASEVDRYIEGLMRRWEPHAKAASFIKTDLLPHKETKAFAMGTVIGEWLSQKGPGRPLDNRRVLDVRIENNVAILVMCDEVYQNTMTLEMTAALRKAIPEINRKAKVIILTSSLGHFHVGLNPSRAREWKGRPTVEVARDMKETYMGFVELAKLGIPIIAVLTGKVYGGGLPIALWCDYRVATTDVDVHYGNLSRGMSPAAQLSKLLGQYVSTSQIMEAYLENAHWDSNDLLRLGIVSHVANSKDEALAYANKLASFIAAQPPQAVRDTMKLMKISYAADVANEEAWLIAKKITSSEEPFHSHAHNSFPRPKKQYAFAEPSIEPRLSAHSGDGFRDPLGIVALEVYTPCYAVGNDTLEDHGILAKMKQGQEFVAVWDDQEDSISMALNAVSALLSKHNIDPYDVGRVEVGTESNVDMAKSIKSYLMDLFPSDHYDIEGVDNTNACYGGTAALLNSIAWCRERGHLISDAKYAIVVATDTAEMDLPDSGWRGASAVAMLVGPNPWIEIMPERSSCFKNTHDFLKPRYSTQKTPHIQTKNSMDHYIHALDWTVENIKTKHAIDPSKFDAFVFHGGMCGTFMKLVERHLLKTFKPSKPWKHNFEAARHAASRMGALYTASMYVNLISLLELSSSVNHIGLFSYGSGSTATLLHATIHHHRQHSTGLIKGLSERSLVSFETLSEIATSKKESGPVAVLERVPGTFYRDVSACGTKTEQRNYFKEGGQVLQRSNHNDRTDLESHWTSILGIIFPPSKALGQRITLGVSLSLATVYWVCAVGIRSSRARNIFGYGAITFFVCLLTHFGVDAMTEHQGVNIRGSAVTLSHYALGVISFLVYFILYMVDDMVFFKNWSAVFFGFYLSDNIMILLRWESIHPAFRLFYSIHHTLAFLVTGAWAWWNELWEDYIILGVMIWLTAEIWQYSFKLCRHFPSLHFSPRQVHHLNLFLFWVERAHRIAAYLMACSLANWELSSFSWFVLATGIIIDIFDSIFQWWSMGPPARPPVNEQSHRSESLHSIASFMENGSMLCLTPLPDHVVKTAECVDCHP